VKKLAAAKQPAATNSINTTHVLTASFTQKRTSKWTYKHWRLVKKWWIDELVASASVETSNNSQVTISQHHDVCDSKGSSPNRSLFLVSLTPNMSDTIEYTSCREQEKRENSLPIRLQLSVLLSTRGSKKNLDNTVAPLSMPQALTMVPTNN